MDRWQNDEVYRESQLVHGWTDEWVKYLDCISEIDISHNALYRQRLRYENTVYMRGVDSNKQAGPLCQRPEYESSADALVSLQRARGKGVPQIPIHLRTRQRDTLDPAVQQHLEWLIFNWKRSSSPSTGTESPTWWSSSSWDNQWQDWHSQGSKNAGTSDNNDNPTIFKLYCSPESSFHSYSCTLLRFFGSFWQFRVQTVATAMNATGCVQRTPHRTHTRALFSRCARSHARCDRTFGSRA